MKYVALASIVLLCAVSADVEGQQACPCVPIAHQWVVTACASWECAATIVGHTPDRYTIPLPTSSSDYGWVVIRRVVSGSSIVSPDEPFQVTTFDTLPVASAHYAATSPDLVPMLLTVADGQFALVARRAPEVRRRITGR